MKKSTLKFDSNALTKQLTENLTKEQTRRLIAYAKEKIQEIGNKILSYPLSNHMDRTGNLLNSLCWGVAYNGELIESGFFRDEVLRPRKIPYTEGETTTLSALHEWSADSQTREVNGRALAQKYINQHGRYSWKGQWRVFFGIFAPYWGYWEQGFTLRGKVRRFIVMAEFYDKVQKDLKPAKVTFKTETPDSSSTTLRIKREKYDRRQRRLGRLKKL